MITEKLIAALERVTFDGTELHGIINSQLPDPELELAASAIRHAVLAQFHDCVPRSAVIEIVGRLLEDGELG
jgi:hypothetical protein